MENKDYLKEIEGYENKSNFFNRVNITIYQLLRLLNNETSYLILSLLSTFLSCYIFGFSYITGLVLHCLVWTIFRKKIINKDKYDYENKNIDLIIEALKTHLNKKSQN